MISPYGTRFTRRHDGPIWLLPTRGRPEGCRKFLEAARAHGFDSPLIVWVDTRAGFYRSEDLPIRPLGTEDSTWIIRAPSDMGPTMAWVFAQFPRASCYGWVADDLVPETDGWSGMLEATAGDWNLACCRDEYLVKTKDAAVPHLTGAFCWGGELVRAVGWWALPGSLQAGIDDAWSEIAVGLGLLVRASEVVVRHDNYRTGRRPMDETDDWHRDGVNFVQVDFDVLTRFRQDGGIAAAQNRVDRAMRAAGVKR